MAKEKLENAKTLMDLIDQLYRMEPSQAEQKAKAGVSAQSARSVTDTLFDEILAGTHDTLVGIQKELAASAKDRTKAADATLAKLKSKKVKEEIKKDPSLATHVEALAAEAKKVKVDAKELEKWQSGALKQMESDLRNLRDVADNMLRSELGKAGSMPSVDKQDEAVPKPSKTNAESTPKPRKKSAP